MRYVMLTLLPFLAIFLQSTIFSNYSINGTVPDVVLIFVTFYALLNGPNKGTFYGIACGLLEDLYLGRFVGIDAISKGLVAYFIGKLQGNVFKENILVAVMVVVLATVLNAGLVSLVMAISMQVFYIDLLVAKSIVYQVLYNGALTAPLYIWYYNSSRNGWLKEIRDV